MNETKLTGLEAARLRVAEMKARGEKPERLDPVAKAKRNPKSRRLAMDAMCWQCQCGDADPAPRWRIGNCRVITCALWRLRPYQSQHGKPEPIALRVEVVA